MKRTDPIALPFLMDQPTGWRISEIDRQCPHRFACDKFCLANNVDTL
jgi:hypothetical protein